MATAERSDRDARPAVSAARVIVPVGLGVWTWLLVTLSAGVVLSTDGLSLLTVVVLAGLALLWYPLVRFRPWAAGATDRVLAFARTHRTALALTVALFVLLRLPIVGDRLSPVLGLVLLPLRAVPQLLFDVSLFYDARLGPPAGQVLFDAARLYVELLWLSVLGRGAAKLASLGGGGE